MAGIHGILTLHRLFLFERNRGEWHDVYTIIFFKKN
jgi:hypothetical protein